jgi:predicted ATPase
MLTSISLRNFKSFGEEQRIPLRPITILVGPNNSGKSAFMSIGQFVRSSLEMEPEAALVEHGGAEFLFHRPAVDDGRMRIAWTVDLLRYQVELEHRSNTVVQCEEEFLYGYQPGRPTARPLSVSLRGDRWDGEGDLYPIVNHIRFPPRRPFSILRAVLGQPDYAALCSNITLPLLNSRLVKLSLAALHEDARVVHEPRLESSGAGLAAVLALWRGADPDRAQRLDDFLHRCLPEVKRALVKPGAVDGTQRLWIQQTDGEMFDAGHVSDGVLFFVALAMHAIDATPGSVLFVDEPEQSIHPRRLGEVVEFFRRIVDEYQCQFVVATHSPILLNQFRDEPEAIVLFRRGEQGTQVKTLDQVPDLVDALRKAEPGEMLANGFFNDAF